MDFFFAVKKWLQNQHDLFKSGHSIPGKLGNIQAASTAANFKAHLIARSIRLSLDCFSLGGKERKSGVPHGL